MGDRGNIFITRNDDTKNNEQGIYLYTHWGGSYLKETLQAALRKKWRWNDEAYLTRIIFCEMIKGYESEETGFGISLEEQDNEHPIVYVLTDTQEVIVEGHCYTFQEFIDKEF